MIKGESHSIQHENKEPHLIKDTAWPSWVWSVQEQKRTGSQLAAHQPASHVVTSHLWFDWTSHRGWNNGMEMGNHEISKSWTCRFVKITTLLWNHYTLESSCPQNPPQIS